MENFDATRQGVDAVDQAEIVQRQLVVGEGEQRGRVGRGDAERRLDRGQMIAQDGIGDRPPGG